MAKSKPQTEQQLENQILDDLTYIVATLKNLAANAKKKISNYSNK